VAAAQPGVSLGGLLVERIDTTDGFKFVFADGAGWCLIRFSGTEPIIRVYCEVLDQARVRPVLADGLRVAGLK
jgi:phosphomannomutase